MKSSVFDIKKGDLVVCTNDGSEFLKINGKPYQPGLTKGNIYKVVNISYDTILIRDDEGKLSYFSKLRFIKITKKVIIQ